MTAMKQTLLMETLLGQTRLAVIEDGELCELYCERPDGEHVCGNIYLGRVENVLPGMNAAFVDIGLKKNGFLYAGDIRLDLRSDPALADRLGKERVDARLRPGQEVLDAARSTYLGTEYSGESDRRPKAGLLKKTNI